MRGAVFGLTVLGLAGSGFRAVRGAEGPASPEVPAVEERSPAEALDAFELADDRLTIEPVVTEPDVVDPVAMAFDADGRLFVIEMSDFQIGSDGEDGKLLGRVRLLQDRDDDGRFEDVRVFADKLAMPTAITTAFGGILVGSAPDIIYLKDTDGDGRADVREVILTGFGLMHAEALLNSFYWGLDNWIHGSGNHSNGEVYPPGKPDAKKVAINDFRVRMRWPAGGATGESFTPIDLTVEATTGGGQFGMAPDLWGNRFSSYNSRHVMQMVLPARYLRRNPYLIVKQAWHSCPDHGAGCKVFRMSPPERWREVRRTLRNKLKTGDRTPGGFLTAGSGALIYRGDALPPEYVGNAFVGGAANNLVHRDVLVADGVTFVAKRAGNEQETDFLRSPDRRFRPVSFGEGPDGGLYVVDMVREIIETPLSVPPHIRETMNWAGGRDRGRIWRIRAKTSRRRPVAELSRATAVELVHLLSDANGWRRMTAQRLLVERQNRSSVEPLRRLFRNSDDPLARLHALCTLEGLSAVDVELLLAGLTDVHPGVRERALRLAEGHLLDGGGPPADALVRAILKLADDAEDRVRFQLAFTLGFLEPDDAVARAMARLAERDAGDVWMRTALLSSVRRGAVALWHALHAEGGTLFAKPSKGATELTRRLMEIIAIGEDDEAIALIVGAIVSSNGEGDTWWQSAVIDGLASGVSHGGAAGRLAGIRPAAETRTPAVVLALLADPRDEIRRAARRLAVRLPWKDTAALRARVERELDVALDEEASVEARVEAIGLAARGPFDLVIDPLSDLLSVYEPMEVQQAAIEAITRMNRPEAAKRLLEAWSEATPALRKTIIGGVAGRTDYLVVLLAAIEADQIPAWAIDATLKDRLLTHKDDRVRDAARRGLSAAGGSNQKVYDRYLAELEAKDWPGDADRGRGVFEERCASCHRYGGVGNVVGPDLNTVIEREPTQLLADVILPSSSITVGYEYYIVETVEGDSISGVIAGESATSITIRQEEGKERTVLRADVDEIIPSRLSMMPEDAYENITPTQMADVIAFVKDPGAPSAN